MNLLLVAATEVEITPALSYFQQNWTSAGNLAFVKGGTNLTICITGVGITATTYILTKTLQNQYDFALQAGIAGSFDTTIPLGKLVLIDREQFGDLGAEDHYNFLDIFDLGLLQPNFAPFSGKELIAPLSPVHEKIQLPKTKGITVNSVSGSQYTIHLRSDKYNPQLESMEGAAFHFVCLKENIPFAQIRSISNYVEPRDKSKWQIKEAIINLNKWLIDFIESL